MTQNAPWTPELDAKLVALSLEKLRLSVIAFELGRTPKAVATRRRKLRLVMQRRVMPRNPLAGHEIVRVSPRRERTEVEFYDWTIRVKAGEHGVKVSAGMHPA